MSRLAQEHWRGDGCPPDAVADNRLAAAIADQEGPGHVPLHTVYPHAFRPAPHPHAARYDEARAAHSSS